MITFYKDTVDPLQGKKKERGYDAYDEDGLPSGFGGILGRSVSNECGVHALQARTVRIGPLVFACGCAVLMRGSRVGRQHKTIVPVMNLGDYLRPE